MTITYLLAYFCTPAVFRFDIPILNISFARFAEFVWPCKFVFSFIKIKFNVYSVLPSMCIMCISSDQYQTYSRVSIYV